MRRELISGTYIQADETPVDVQMHEGRGRNHQAYLWQYSRPGGSVVFDFRLGRGRDGPKRFLGQFEGVLQTDGYAAYDQIGGPRMVHAACWSHARRQFFEAVQLNPGDPVATPIVARMDDLFSILYFCAWAQGIMRSVVTTKTEAATMIRFRLTDFSDSIFSPFCRPRKPRTRHGCYGLESPLAKPPDLPASRSCCGSRRPKSSISFATTPVHPV